MNSRKPSRRPPPIDITESVLLGDVLQPVLENMSKGVTVTSFFKIYKNGGLISFEVVVKRIGGNKVPRSERTEA